jgi:hypothetical protein
MPGCSPGSSAARAIRTGRSGLLKSAYQLSLFVQHDGHNHPGGGSCRAPALFE